MSEKIYESICMKFKQFFDIITKIDRYLDLTYIKENIELYYNFLNHYTVNLFSTQIKQLTFKSLVSFSIIYYYT